jgi:hypothetical protein
MRKPEKLLMSGGRGVKMHPAPASSRRRARQKGNAFVETAFVIVPLFAMIFAIVDFGLAIFLKSTLQHATREGVRYAVTYQTANGMGHDASIRAVVRSNAMGLLSSDESAENITIRYYDPDTLVEVGGNDPGNLIEVSVENHMWGWLGPLMRSATPIQMTARSSDRMEGLPTGQQPPGR